MLAKVPKILPQEKQLSDVKKRIKRSHKKMIKEDTNDKKKKNNLTTVILASKYHHNLMTKNCYSFSKIRYKSLLIICSLHP